VSNVSEYRKARLIKQFGQVSFERTFANTYRVKAGTGGKKYIRILCQSGADHWGSVYCFVEIATGLVLKAAGFKAPETKNPRGSIYSDAFVGYGVGDHGANYIR
jgi:hypothetical protein